VTGDGYLDIVEGIPRSRPYGDHPGSPGIVAILRGGPRGPGSRLELRPGSPGIPGESRGDDQFGASVATADVDRDGYADIVAGAPGTRNYRGRVTIIRGGPAGYATTGNLMLGEDTTGVPGRPARYRVFGASVSFLDADGDGGPELVVGVPGAGGGDRGYGALTVIDRPLAGPAPARARSLTLRAIGVEAPEAPDASFLAAPFGAVLGHPGASSSTGYAFY
jgi:hypothetical protein